MTNSEKYATAKERIEAFRVFCDEKMPLGCSKCALGKHANGFRYPLECFAYWLDLEAPAEKPLPCPFCGAPKVHMVQNGYKTYRLGCTCGYSTQFFATQELVIAAHNRVAKAVKDGNNEPSKLTNAHKYKTASERFSAYKEYCKSCDKSGVDYMNEFYWLEQPYCSIEK